MSLGVVDRTTHLVENGSLAEEAWTVHAAEGLLVRMDPQMLREMGLLAESFAALGTGIGSRFDVYAAMLEQGRLLLELLVADGATHIERHVGGSHSNMLQYLG